MAEWQQYVPDHEVHVVCVWEFRTQSGDTFISVYVGSYLAINNNF